MCALAFMLHSSIYIIVNTLYSFQLKRIAKQDNFYTWHGMMNIIRYVRVHLFRFWKAGQKKCQSVLVNQLVLRATVWAFSTFPPPLMFLCYWLSYKGHSGNIRLPHTLSSTVANSSGSLLGWGGVIHAVGAVIPGWQEQPSSLPSSESTLSILSPSLLRVSYGFIAPRFLDLEKHLQILGLMQWTVAWTQLLLCVSLIQYLLGSAVLIHLCMLLGFSL